VVEFRLLVSVYEAWQWSRIHNLRRVGKNYGPILSRLWTKVFGDILRRRRRPLVVSNALTRLRMSCFVPNIKTAKVVVKLWRRPKGGFGTRFLWEGDVRDLEHAFSNRTYLRPCGRFSLSSFQRARGVCGEKRKKERRKKESVVKQRSADGYVGRPNNLLSDWPGLWQAIRVH